MIGNSSFSMFANFTDDNGVLNVTAITNPSYSTKDISSSYFSTNTAADGSGTTSSNISLTSSYLFGTAYEMVFTNNGSQTVYITAVVLYGNPASADNTISQNYKDQDSINAYGCNPANNGVTLTIDDNYIQDTSTALGLAYDIVTRYSQPNQHYDVEIFSNPTLQIGDFGTINPDGLGTQSVWITGKTDKMIPEGNLTQILKLEEKIIYNYFTINVSIIGGTDRIAT
jgi:hypothetical protein